MPNQARRGPPEEWQPIFLRHLRDCGVIRRAAEVTPIGQSTVLRYRHLDPVFDEAVQQALRESCELFEVEARRRAIEGVMRKQFTRGGEPIIDPATGQQYYERVYSDSLLMFLMRGAYPEKYNRTQTEVTGKDGGPVRIRAEDLSDEELLAIARRGRADSPQAPGGPPEPA